MTTPLSLWDVRYIDRLDRIVSDIVPRWTSDLGGSVNS